MSCAFYEWVWVPVDLMNVPSCFQRFMEYFMEEYWDQFIVQYLDDLLIYSANFEEHLEHLWLVPQRQKRHSIRVKTSKCHLFKREISYLARIIIAVLSKLKNKPPSMTELQSIVELMGYFKRPISVKQQAHYIGFLLTPKTNKDILMSTQITICQHTSKAHVKSMQLDRGG